MRIARTKHAFASAAWCAAALLACGLWAATPAAVRAQHEEHADGHSAEHAAEHEAGHDAHGAGHDGHGHEPVTLDRIFKDTGFWGSVINFALLLLVLRRLGKKPLNAFLGNRRRDMEREISAAAEMRAKAEAKFQEYTQRMAQLDDELATLRKDIERGAQDDKARILAEADETARRLRRETEGLIDQHAKALGDSIRRDLVTAAVARAETLLRDAVTEADQQRIAQGYVQTIGHDSRDAVPASSRARSALSQEPS